MVSADIKKRVVAKVEECINTVENHFKINFKKPTISFNVRGTTGGTADYRKWEVDFNPVLLTENVEAFLARTVPHEVAHLATDLVYPHVHRPGFGRKRQPHGAHWASIMTLLGADPTRCHSYDTTNARVKRTNSYEYKCTCCGVTMTLGPKRHAKMLKNPHHYTHTNCGRIHGKLVLASQHTQPAAPMQVVKPAPLPTHAAPKPVFVPPKKKIQVKIKKATAPATKPSIPTGETKLAKCYKLFENYPGYTRAEMINVFVQEAGCTPAGAATYYATCKKIYG